MKRADRLELVELIAPMIAGRPEISANEIVRLVPARRQAVLRVVRVLRRAESLAAARAGVDEGAAGSALSGRFPSTEKAEEGP